MKYAIFHKGKRLPGNYSCGQEAHCAVMRMGFGGWKLAEYEVREIKDEENETNEQKKMEII